MISLTQKFPITSSINQHHVSSKLKKNPLCNGLADSSFHSPMLLQPRKGRGVDKTSQRQPRKEPQKTLIYFSLVTIFQPSEPRNRLGRVKIHTSPTPILTQKEKPVAKATIKCWKINRKCSGSVDPFLPELVVLSRCDPFAKTRKKNDEKETISWPS